MPKKQAWALLLLAILNCLFISELFVHLSLLLLPHTALDFVVGRGTLVSLVAELGGLGLLGC